MTQIIPASSSSLQLPKAPGAISRTDQIAEVIKTAILDGTLRPGQALVERDLAEMLGVSKTPVREALKHLRGTGLLSANSYRAVSVRVIDSDVVQEVYRARLGVEPYAVQMAVSRLGAGRMSDARRFLESAAVHRADGDRAAMGVANRQFHRALYSQCANSFLTTFLDNLADLTTLVATTGWQRGGQAGDEAVEHDRILELAESGDADGVAEALSQHIEGAATSHIATLGSEPT